MKVAFVKMGAVASDWPALCDWLDKTCHGWSLAHHHRDKIESYRLGTVGWAYEINYAVIKVSEEQAVLILLFREHTSITWRGEAMSDDERIMGAELSEYRGGWAEFPAELLSESTKSMIRRSLRKRTQ